MEGGLTVLRVLGIPIRIHPSWLVILGLIAWSLSVGYFPHVLPDLPPRAYWASGLVAALLLFVSVLLHELAHALVARGRGLRVAGITLHVFGGVSQLEQEPDRPRVELEVALVGPLTSFALAGLVALAARLPLPLTAHAVLRYLALANLAVGLFNLLPGFPLDGGRVLRAVLWQARGDLTRATQLASRIGSGFAFALMGLGVLRGLAGEFLGGLWFVLIGLFLRQASEGSYRQLLLRRALAPFTVRDVMTREVVHVPADLPVARVVDEYFWRHHVTSFPVLDGGRVVGILSLHQLAGVPQERWLTTPAREVMQALAAPLVAGPGERLWPAFERLSRNGLGRLAVLDDGRLVGYLSFKDVLHVLALAGARRGSPGGLA